MAINIICKNSNCKFYWENNCTKNMGEKLLKIDENGQCITFEKGTSDWYKKDCRACADIFECPAVDICLDGDVLSCAETFLKWAEGGAWRNDGN